MIELYIRLLFHFELGFSAVYQLFLGCCRQWDRLIIYCFWKGVAKLAHCFFTWSCSRLLFLRFSAICRNCSSRSWPICRRLPLQSSLPFSWTPLFWRRLSGRRRSIRVGLASDPIFLFCCRRRLRPCGSRGGGRLSCWLACHGHCSAESVFPIWCPTL